MKLSEKVDLWLEQKHAQAQERILYGLRYSGLSIKWGGARLLEWTLGKVKLKMQDLHAGAVSTANRIWEERERLGQEDQEVTGDQFVEVMEGNPDKVEEPVDSEELLIVGEEPYEVEEPSENIVG